MRLLPRTIASLILFNEFSPNTFIEARDITYLMTKNFLHDYNASFFVMDHSSSGHDNIGWCIVHII